MSLSPAASVMLRDAGMEPKIVGRHGWDAVLDQSLPVAGDQTGFDYERLVSLEPTHVVIEWGSRELPPRLLGLAESRDFELISIDTLGLEDIAASAIRLSSAFADATDLSPKSDRLLRERESSRSLGTVLLVVATSPTIDCLGPGSAHHQLLVRGGFTPALRAGGPWIALSLEDVIALNPDVLVLIQPDAEELPLADRLGPLADAPIRAVERGSIVLIDEPLSLIPGTNLVAFADEVWALLDGLAGTD